MLLRVMKLGWLGGRWNANTSSGEAITGGSTSLRVSACRSPAARDALQQALAHRAALAVEASDGVIVQIRAVLDGKVVFLAHLSDQRKRITQAARENEFRVLAPFDTSLDELDQTEHIDIELMLLEQPLDVPQLLDRERKARLRRGEFARAADQSK